MKRLLAPALILGLMAPVGLVGCGEESKVKQQETVSGPSGTTTETKETKIKTTGENPPTTTSGEPGATTPPPAK